MPFYVQRNFLGKIVGLMANPSVQEDGYCLTDPDPLPDDHPEVVEFLKEHPSPIIQPITQEQRLVHDKQYEENRENSEKLQRLMLSHFQQMADLELALGALLQAILNIKAPNSNVARAIYFSIPGFDQRCVTLGRAIEQFVHDHLQADKSQYDDISRIAEAWSKLQRPLKSVRATRNVVAHGSVSLIPHGGRHHARLTAPVFDPIRVGNLINKGSIPGLGVSDLQRAIILIRHVSMCADRINDCITAYHDYGLPALVEKCARLDANLKTLESLA
jgi:hypothetical protein